LSYLCTGGRVTADPYPSSALAGYRIHLRRASTETHTPGAGVDAEEYLAKLLADRTTVGRIATARF